MSKNRKKSKIPKNKTEIFNQFQEQLSFLKNSAKLYDAGDWSAIKMASVPLRTLFYKQRFGPILIDEIEEVNKSLFFSTAYFPSDATTYIGEIAPINFVRNSIRAGDKIHIEVESTYVPMLSDQVSFRKINFYTWLKGRIFISEGDSFTREDLIKFIANQDGGGHVDDSLTKKYHRMVHNIYSTQFLIGNDKADNIHLALLRQIVHEALYSFQKMRLLNFEYDTKQTSDFFKKHNLSLIRNGGLSIMPPKQKHNFCYY